MKILKDIFLRRCSESLLLKYDNPLKSGAISHKTSTRPEHKRKRKHCKTETKKNISSWLAGSAPEHTSGRFYNWFWMGARAIIYAKSEVEKTLENLQKRVSRKRFQPPFLGSRRWTRVHSRFYLFLNERQFFFVKTLLTALTPVFFHCWCCGWSIPPMCSFVCLQSSLFCIFCFLNPPVLLRGQSPLISCRIINRREY